MKPSWDDAPEWANWLAQDEDGSWWWYEDKPKLNLDIWWGCDRMMPVFGKKEFTPNWRETLEQRPVEEVE